MEGKAISMIMMIRSNARNVRAARQISPNSLKRILWLFPFSTPGIMP
jgi:hypothetical protein